MKICSLQKKILIIKFGGLGDVILSLNAIYSIFNHHNKSKLILLTEEPYNKLLVNSNWFEKIFTIKKSSITVIIVWITFANPIRIILKVIDHIV